MKINYLTLALVIGLTSIANIYARESESDIDAAEKHCRCKCAETRVPAHAIYDLRQARKH